MIVTCCPQQLLLKTGKSVKMCKTFSHTTWSRLNVRNYVIQSAVPFREKVRLGASKRLSSDSRSTVAKLTPQEVDQILRANEYTHEFASGSVKSYDSNQLASNSPIEDTRAEASCLITSGFLVGVFDGHSGGACAQILSKRLYQYIAACLLPHDHLQNYVSSLDSLTPQELIRSYNENVQLVDDIKDLYQSSFQAFLSSLVESGERQGFEMSKALEKAFLRLDSDFSKEAFPNADQVNLKALSVAMSGAVACVAHIDGAHLHIANVGDCCAVLGSLTDTNSWIAKKLTQEHNVYNKEEVERIVHEHPESEANTVIMYGRLLSHLAPFRAMGDFCYKWDKELVYSVVARYYGQRTIPPNYHTPPYLSSRPDVTHYRLTPRDKFLVIASDGLWDFISPLEVVRLVGEHMSGKLVLSPLKIPRQSMTLSEVNELLLQRKEALKTKPKDKNAATHLIRNALGGTELGVEHSELSRLLSLPKSVSRMYRDDITIAVVYFDSEYLRHCPA